MVKIHDIPCSVIFLREKDDSAGTFLVNKIASFEANMNVLLNAIGKDRCCEYFDLIEKPVDVDN